ncbi:putative membrane protein [Actinoplanes octamycinicus]|uniref:Putative membrane protein n=1 Tax=Actinoplanes octamycinicus TaxID=135948 RepID=A0A7W7H3M5_9ACTN|nr:DUF1772 domain-containing protein [Actinoplanes octamycinicus]MBB4743333.1 putative membrane protein [Actinoplanes octamycinicus]GIE61849.1 hypothetical protein Aoc01nite_72510 [Actinoplanes octamycinicus]
MSLVDRTLTMTVLTGSGLLAGVLFAVALSVVPALAAMTPDRYVVTHQLLGRRYDRVMPLINLASFGSAVTLAARSDDGARTALLAGVAVALAGVALVSQLGNVPINRRVKRTDPARVDDSWADPRRRWRGWNLLRTTFAVTACVLAAAAVVTPW